MPTMQGSLSVAANSVSLNVLAGNIYEFLPANARLTFSCTGSATGLNTTLIAQGVSLINDSAINAANRFPQIPTDIMSQEVVPGGSRLVNTFRNTTAGALTAFWRFDF